MLGFAEDALGIAFAFGFQLFGPLVGFTDEGFASTPGSGFGNGSGGFIFQALGLITGFFADAVSGRDSLLPKPVGLDLSLLHQLIGTGIEFGLYPLADLIRLFLQAVLDLFAHIIGFILNALLKLITYLPGYIIHHAG